MDIDSALNQMRQEHSPTQQDRERVRAALSAALAVSGTAGLAHVATSAGLKGASLKGTVLALPVWIKGTIGVGSLLAAVGGLQGYNAYQASKRTASPTEQAAPFEPPSARGEGAPAEPPIGAGEALALESTNPPSPGEVTQASAQHDEERTAAGKSRGKNRKAPASLTTTSLTTTSLTTTSLAELRLIGEASRALREGRTEEARSALAEHERQYANTALAQERGALELLARCAEGNSDETRRAAESFLRVSPKSPMAGTLRRECLK